MTTLKFLPDDPKLTAYALGELEPADAAAVEAALRDDPAAQQTVAETRAIAAQLEMAFAAEPMTENATALTGVEQGAAIVARPDPLNLERGPRSGKRGGENRTSKLLRFPNVLGLAGGLAAAGFALVVALHEPIDRSRNVSHESVREDVRAVPVAAAPVPAANGETIFAGLLEPKEMATDAAVTVTVVGPPAPALIEEKAVAMVGPAIGEIAPAANAPSPTNGMAPVISDAGASPRATSAAVAQMPPEHQHASINKMDTSLLAHAARELETWQREVLPARNGTLRAAPALAPELAAAVASAPRVAMSQGVPGGVATSSGRRVIPPQAPRDRLVAANEEIVVLSAFAVDGYAASSTLAGARVKGRGIREANTETYRYQRESDFLTVRENPLSTFSADVDTASYANVRRFLRDGKRPPVDAVRIEELVNYFPYRYAAPAKDEPFAADIEVAGAPWAPAHRLVRIGLKAREVTASARGAANLVFLLDVSGSMDQPNKLPLVKESLRLLLSRLRSDDQVAIVTYAGASGLALPSTPVKNGREISAAIDELSPQGSTNGAMGIQLAYDIAKANFVPGGINRVILCTDGDFNVGVTNEGALVRLVQQKAKSGVFLTVLGFGMGNYKDALLQQIADRGNGHYGYIDTRREAEKLLVEQVSGTLVTVAKDVKLQVEFNSAKVSRYRLIGYEKRLLNREDFNNDAVDAGEVGSGHTVTALYEVVPVDAEPAGPTSNVGELKYWESGAARFTPRVSRGAAADELLTLKLRYKKPDGLLSKKLEFPLVDRGTSFADASADFRFAAAVAAFGMLLRDSPHQGEATWESVATWAGEGAGEDEGGYRAEFSELVELARALSQE